MHHFATPLRPAQQTASASSLRASQYKRKRDVEEDDAEPPGGLDRDASNAPLPEFDPSEREQRRLAGLSTDDAFQIPAPPFPHAPPRPSRANFTSTSIKQELAKLSPAIYTTDASSNGQRGGSKGGSSALRTTHLNVLSTVMYRCLLEGDYQRAARAWGMILRTRAHGTPIEPRYNGLWGLGAELLMRRGSGNHNAYGDTQDAHAGGDQVYSDAGFQLAREYYERLILQYPIRKYQPFAIDATTFYPPLFSVWIMQVLERSKRARQQRKQTSKRSLHANVDMDENSVLSTEELRALEEEIQQEELTGAREICQRLDQLVESPPYDKDVQMLRLRGNVGLWISDLLVGKTAAQEQDDDWGYDSDSAELRDENEPATERVKKTPESLREAKKAQGFFDRAARISNEHSHDAASA